MGDAAEPEQAVKQRSWEYVSATFTGHSIDTTLDIYFAEARFYDASNRIWLAMDPIKDGGNWYQYCSNPTTYIDPTGLWGMVTTTKQAQLSGSEMEPALFWRQRLIVFAEGNGQPEYTRKHVYAGSDSIKRLLQDIFREQM